MKHMLLNIAAASVPPPYTGTTEIPIMQAKVNTDPDVSILSLIPREWSVFTSKGMASAAPVRWSDNDRRNRGGGCFQRSFPWINVTEVKQKIGENQLEYVECFCSVYENYCAANDNEEDYDSPIVIESATSGLSKE